QFVFNTGLALAMARMGSKTPDLAQLLPFVLRTWMYASGVMYSMTDQLRKAHAPHWVIEVLGANPAAVFIDLMRFALIDNFGAGKLPSHVWVLAVGWALVVGAGGFVYFWKAEEQYGRG
ncbi:ABC transporter permease, partial [Streptomyces sp. NPDC050610]